MGWKAVLSKQGSVFAPRWTDSDRLLLLSADLVQHNVVEVLFRPNGVWDVTQVPDRIGISALMIHAAIERFWLSVFGCEGCADGGLCSRHVQMRENLERTCLERYVNDLTNYITLAGFNPDRIH